MLKPRKRITKRQLKEDKLVTSVFKIQTFLENEWQRIAMGIGAAAIILFVGYFLYNSNVQKDEQAAGALYELELRYFMTVYDSTLITGLENFLQRHDDTSSSGNAGFYLANTYYNLGDYNKAVVYYRKVVDDYDGPDFLKASSLGGIAACYEQLQRYLEAAEFYQKAIDQYSNEFVTSENLLGAARVFVKLDRIDEARSRCRRIIDNYPNTQQAVEAEIMLASM